MTISMKKMVGLLQQLDDLIANPGSYDATDNVTESAETLRSHLINVIKGAGPDDLVPNPDSDY